MSDVPGWRLFTKAVSAPIAEPTKLAPKGSLNRSNDPHGLKKLKKCQAKTTEGVMRLADKIIEDGRSQRSLEIRKSKEPKYSEQRCETIDPNAYRAPLDRVRSPRETRNRRPENWTARWFVLPKVTVEGLRTLAIELAKAQQHSEWPGERRRYPRSANYHVMAALNDYFARLGYGQFCVEEQKPLKQRVRRFVAPNV